LELAFSLLFALPGTPMLQYGDEIGMGDNLSLPERECARTPMQWTSEEHGGISRARQTGRPVIASGEWGYSKRNVASQRRDPDSFLNWIERSIRMRRECPEISWGQVTILDSNAEGVLILRYDWRETSLVTLHKFAREKRTVHLAMNNPAAKVLVNVFKNEFSKAGASGKHLIQLEPHGWRWFRVGAADTALQRSEF
jgi:maltose alpha-D-glucosyltransferase / alpha-amylase